MLNLQEAAIRAGLRAGGQTLDWFCHSNLAVDYYAEGKVRETAHGRAAGGEERCACPTRNQSFPAR